MSIRSIRTFFRLFAHVQMLPILESGEETLVGGQAVMEGVMMRAPHSYCVAVRKPSGEIVTEEMPVPRMSEKYPLFKWPVLRGLGYARPGDVARHEGAEVFRQCRARRRLDRKKPTEVSVMDDDRAGDLLRCLLSSCSTSWCR